MNPFNVCRLECLMARAAKYRYDKAYPDAVVKIILKDGSRTQTMDQLRTNNGETNDCPRRC